MSSKGTVAIKRGTTTIQCWQCDLSGKAKALKVTLLSVITYICVHYGSLTMKNGSCQKVV